ncbi:MAG: DUF3037 domain-containing protein [Chloroflexi bacterium]|nr:MAG: DUF3037 domain-containing protein [Chloroflexota bacterium]
MADGIATYDYAVLRVVPRVERCEFLNAGVILFCRTQRFLAAATALDQALLAALAPPGFDVEGACAALATIPAICAGEGAIGALPQADRFHWICAPHSTIIQTSPVHCGRCINPAAALEHLLDRMVRR